MAIFGFGKKKEDDIEKVKQAVNPPALMDLPEELPSEVKSIERKIELREPSEKPVFAPLFIKVERYREILEQLEMLKNTLKNMEELMKLRNSIDRIRGDMDASFERQIESFKMVLSQLDTELVKPQSSEPYIKPKKVESVSNYTKEIQSEIDRLEAEIEKLGK